MKYRRTKTGYTGWLLAVLAPLLAVYSLQSLPYPGSLIAAGAVVGGFIGYLVYEHVETRGCLTATILLEKLLLGLLILVMLVIAT